MPVIEARPLEFNTGNSTPATMAARLKKARLEAGFRTATKAIERFGWKGSTYRAHENGQNNFGPPEAAQYGRAYGVSAGWLLTGEPVARATVTTHTKQNPSGQSGNISAIPLKGSVAAGVWREPSVIGDLDFGNSSRPFPVDPRFPVEAQFDLLVSGSSLNQIALENDYLRCVDVGFAQIQLTDGDIVIVERTKAGLREVSAKRLRKLNDRLEFWHVSDDPKWQTPVIVKDGDRSTSEQVRIVAKVLWVHRPLGN